VVLGGAKDRLAHRAIEYRHLRDNALVAYSEELRLATWPGPIASKQELAKLSVRVVELHTDMSTVVRAPAERTVGGSVVEEVLPKNAETAIRGEFDIVVEARAGSCVVEPPHLSQT